MKLQFAILAGVLCMLTGTASAGPAPIDAKDIVEAPKITEPSDWHFNIASPGWVAFLSGTVGLQGVNSDVDLNFDQLIRHASFVMSLSADVRKGRWGVYGDFLYMSLDDAVYPERMLSKANINLDEWLVDGELYYRVWEGSRGWLDLRAGARYTDLYDGLKLFGNSRIIDQASAAFVAAADQDLRRLLEHLLGGGHSPLPIPPFQEIHKREILRLIRLARQDPMTAEAKISKILNKELNRTFNLTERWVDPYIGAGGVYNLNKVFYVTGKVDVGGFGAASDIATQASAAIGCHLTRRSYCEIGYRVLYDNYEDDSNKFVWKTTTQGLQITSGITF